MTLADLHCIGNERSMEIYVSYPIDIIFVKDDYNPVNMADLNVENDRLVMRYKDGLGYRLLAHDLGHFLAATDEELFQRNLGLSLSTDRGHVMTEYDQLVELHVNAYQERLIGDRERKGDWSNFAKVGHQIFKFTLDQLEELYNKPEYSMEAIYAELDRKFKLIKERAMKKELVLV